VAFAQAKGMPNNLFKHWVFYLSLMPRKSGEEGVTTSANNLAPGDILAKQ
jgi:hypothetical protein